MNLHRLVESTINSYLLNEMLSSKCYHFTTLDGLLRILKTNTFLLKTDVVSDTEHWEDKPRYRFFMSTTRVRDGRFGYNHFIDKDDMLIRITLNGDLLNTNYRGKPINWQMHSNKIRGYDSDLRSAESTKSKSMYNVPDRKIAQIQPFVENEDRIYSNRPSIPNADRYIERIDILTYLSNDFVDIDTQAMDILQNIPARFRNITHIYTTMKDFNKQKDNTDKVDRSNVEDTKYPKVYVNLSQDDLKKIDYYEKCIYNFFANYDKLEEFVRNEDFDPDFEVIENGLYEDIEDCEDYIKELNTNLYNNKKSKQILKNVSDWFIKHHIVNFNELNKKFRVLDQKFDNNKYILGY